MNGVIQQKSVITEEQAACRRDKGEADLPGYACRYSA